MVRRTARDATGQTEAAEAGVKQRILDAGLEEFSRMGLRGASVRTIGAEAGTTPAMINYYFGGKRGLYGQVVEQSQTRLMAHLAAALAGLADKPIAELAASLTGAYFDFLGQQRALQRLLLREVLDAAAGEALPTEAWHHLGPLLARLPALRGEAFEAAVSLFGAVAGYFIYAPVLARLTGEDPLAPENLAHRRAHLTALARRLFDESATPQDPDADADTAAAGQTTSPSPRSTP